MSRCQRASTEGNQSSSQNSFMSRAKDRFKIPDRSKAGVPQFIRLRPTDEQDLRTILYWFVWVFTFTDNMSGPLALYDFADLEDRIEIITSIWNPEIQNNPCEFEDVAFSFPHSYRDRRALRRAYEAFNLWVSRNSPRLLSRGTYSDKM